VERRGNVCVVLTAAHVVANSTFIQVQLAGQPEKVTAVVTAVAHETDLATVQAPASFFEGVAPLPLAPPDALPALRDKVFVLGFPIGGDDLSITEGVVSRIEVQSYSHSHARALAVTVDAAVNSGNSGGPVVSEVTGEVVGIAFQGYAGSDVENQGHLVPPPLIGRFLAAARAGRPTGLPSLGVYLQLLQSPALRAKLGLAPAETGVLVTWVEHGSCCEGVLRIGDVLTHVAGLAIANDGTCPILGRRLALAAVLHSHIYGDVLPLRILRDGAPLAETVTLKATGGLVPRGQYDVTPPYFLLAGLLFQPLSLEYLSTWGEITSAPPHLLQLYYDGVRTPARTEVVLLTQVLADEANVGYSGDTHGMDVVTHLNGERVRDLRSFVAAVQAALGAGDAFIELSTARGDLTQRVVLAAPGVDAADARIAARYHVPACCSAHFAELLPPHKTGPHAVAAAAAAAAAASAAV
jgi:S1-C subfamily serine protease